MADVPASDDIATEATFLKNVEYERIVLKSRAFARWRLSGVRNRRPLVASVGFDE